MVDLSNQTVGRYQIVELLGTGGMAVVYKAHDSTLDRDVALKIIRTEMFPPAILQTSLKRFEREAKALARISHPNILNIYDFGEYEGAPFLVMEYLAGGTLKDRLGQPVAFQRAAALISPVAQALAYAHSENIIHRDVKPANILFTQRGIPKLSDFGIAKLFDVEESMALTASNMAIGTPAYMAPEQWNGKASPASDIYALGVVFYELLTGAPPYQSDTPGGLLVQIMTQPLPDARLRVPGLPAEAANCVATALAKEPEARFSSMSEFAAALEKLAAPAAAHPASTQTELPTLVETVEPKIDPAGQASEPTYRVPVEKAPPPPATIKLTAPIPLSRRAISWKLLARWALVGVLIIALLSAAFYIGSKTLGSRQALPTTQEAARITPSPQEVGAALSSNTPQPSRTPTGTIAPPTSTLTPQPSLTPTQTHTRTPTLGVGSTRISPKDGMLQVYVPQGAFTLGCDPQNKGSLDNATCNSVPLSTLTLDAFWIDQTEITNAMYSQCVLAGACSPPAFTSSQMVENYYPNPEYALYPVIWVAWADAAAYCAWADRRLPTLQEWVKAARGASDARPYPWGNETPTCSRANVVGCISDTAPVGSYPLGASPYHVLDMLGNVGEWVDDEKGCLNTFRDNQPLYPCFWHSPDVRAKDAGFRCAASP